MSTRSIGEAYEVRSSLWHSSVTREFIQDLYVLSKGGATVPLTRSVFSKRPSREQQRGALIEQLRKLADFLEKNDV